MESFYKEYPHARKYVENNEVGVAPYFELCKKLKPRNWFAGHMHVKLKSLFKHSNNEETSFLALDKPIEGRKFIDFLEFPCDENAKKELSFDVEWLSILKSTHSLYSFSRKNVILPSDHLYKATRTDFSASKEEIEFVKKNFSTLLISPHYFVKTVPSLVDNKPSLFPYQNPQTVFILKSLQIDSPSPAFFTQDWMYAPNQSNQSNKKESNNLNIDNQDKNSRTPSKDTIPVNENKTNSSRNNQNRNRNKRINKN